MGTATSAGNAVTIRNSYSHASITANGGAMGGILGYAGYATVSSNYFAGIVNDTSGTDNERGVVGYDWSQNTLLNNFFDTDVCTTGSGCASSVYVEARPRNTVQMKSVATYLRTGAWDFLTKWTTPGQVYNGQYPVLLWEAGQSALPTALPGGGILGNPYSISTANQWFAFINENTRWTNSSYVQLTANIDFAGVELSPIGLSGKAYNGNFNGNSFTISNFVIDGTVDDDQMGLFGNVASTGSISNLILSSVTVRGDGEIGGLAGYSAGSIYRTAVRGTSLIENVSNASNLGALVGKWETRNRR